jgi:hypothetical protein
MLITMPSDLGAELSEAARWYADEPEMRRFLIMSGRASVVGAPPAPAAAVGGSARDPGLWCAALCVGVERRLCLPAAVAPVAGGEGRAAPGASRCRRGRGSRGDLRWRPRRVALRRRPAAPLGCAGLGAAAVAARVAGRTDAHAAGSGGTTATCRTRTRAADRLPPWRLFSRVRWPSCYLIVTSAA